MEPNTNNDGVLPLNLDDGTRLIASSMAGGAHKDAREDRMPAFIDLDRIERGDGTYVVTRVRYVPQVCE